MLNKQRSIRPGIIKYVFSAPLFIAMLTFSSATLSEVNVPDLVKKDHGVANSTQRSPGKEVVKASDKVSKNARIRDLQKTPKTLSSSPAVDTSIHRSSSIDVFPEYPGGMQKFYKQVNSNFKIPEYARKNGVKGRVLLRFIVEKDGSLSNIRIIEDLGMGTGEEAVRALQNSLKWKPGMNEGAPVRVEYTLPIHLNVPAARENPFRAKSPGSPLYPEVKRNRTSRLGQLE